MFDGKTKQKTKINSKFREAKYKQMTTESKDDKTIFFSLAKLAIFQGFQLVEGQPQMNLRGDYVQRPVATPSVLMIADMLVNEVIC